MEARYAAGMDRSELDTPPVHILVHDPHDCASLDALTPAELTTHNFLDLPDPSRIRGQHEAFRAGLARHTKVVTLGELLNGDPGFAAESASNPNLMFTRDSSITLPCRDGDRVSIARSRELAPWA